MSLNNFSKTSNSDSEQEDELMLMIDEMIDYFYTDMVSGRAIVLHDMLYVPATEHKDSEMDIKLKISGFLVIQKKNPVGKPKNHCL